jgi:hypothetical protein
MSGGLEAAGPAGAISQTPAAHILASVAERRRGWRGRVFIATSLDGYIDSSLDWLTSPPAGIEHQPVSSDRHSRRRSSDRALKAFPPRP